jgi:hypothetical protein
MRLLLLGILFGILAQVLVFFQIQGSLKYPFLQNNQWLVLLSGIPITWLFVESVKYIFDWSGGQLWPGRLIGFSIGIVVFTAMSILLFGEGIKQYLFYLGLHFPYLDTTHIALYPIHQ